MVDLKEECPSVSGDEQNMSQSSSSQTSGGELKSCTGCSTTTTPLWRGGPAGPKTLCNACGIKYHKKRRALMGIENGKMEKAKSKKKIKIRSGGIGSNGQQGKTSCRIPLKFKVVMNKFNDNGDEFLGNKQLGEEEQAALLLMAISCGSVYA